MYPRGMAAPDIAGNLGRVRSQIADALATRGPGPEVTLIGVSKRQPPAALRAAVDAGLRDLGENYAQELASKLGAPELAGCTPRWHFIGALQSNKARLVVGEATIHTVDRPSLVTAIANRARALGIPCEVLVEVNLGGEAQKAGVDPESLDALLDAIAAENGALRCVGLMLIPPSDTPQRSRPYFAALRELAARTRPRQHVELRALSMGMSGDFPEAIAEGATMVRVGTAIFGARS